MSTPIERALNSKNLFIGFAALVTAATAWSIWGQDMFPADAKSTSTSQQSKGPDAWSESELRNWLEKRNLPTLKTESREDLLARVKNVMSNAK